MMPIIILPSVSQDEEVPTLLMKLPNTWFLYYWGDHDAPADNPSEAAEDLEGTTGFTFHESQWYNKNLSCNFLQQPDKTRRFILKK